MIPVGQTGRPTTSAQQYADAARAVRADLRAIYTEPDAARRALIAAAQHRGPEAAAAALQTRPERYGTVLPGTTPERCAGAARNALRYFAAGARPDRASRAELREIAGPIIEADRVQRADAALHHGVSQSARTLSRKAKIDEERASIRHAVRGVRDEAAEVYARPDAALRAIRAKVRAHGPGEAARAVRTEPWRFGELRGVERTRYLGFVTETSYREAIARVPELAARVEAGARRLAVRPRAGEVRRAPMEVMNARRGLEAAKAAREALGRGVDASERLRVAAGRIAGTIQRLGPQSAAKLMQQLVPMVPTSAGKLVKSAAELGKLMMFGRDPERERDRGER